MTEEKSHFQKVLDNIIEEQASYRRQYIEYLMGNPGFLATFGEDFVVEYRDMNLSTLPGQDFNELNEYRVTFSQEVRFYRREVWDKLQKAHTSGLYERVEDAQARFRAAVDQGDDTIADAISKELTKLQGELMNEGLRLKHDGTLESV